MSNDKNVVVTADGVTVWMMDIINPSRRVVVDVSSCMVKRFDR